MFFFQLYDYNYLQTSHKNPRIKETTKLSSNDGFYLYHLV